MACALPVILGVRYWDQIPETVETGLIGGNGAGALNPQGEASRAEVAAILQRFVTARNS